MTKTDMNTIHFIENIRKTAALDGQRTAVVYNNGTDSLSYAELDRLSSALADKICHSGIEPGTPVTVMMQRDALSIAAEIGVLKAGAVFVPVVPSYPQERVDFIMKDCGAKLLIDSSFYEDLSEADPGFETVFPCEDMVMIGYTSGSTGRPKGIVYDLAAYNMTVHRLTAHFEGLDPVILCSFAPMAFIAHLLEFATVFDIGGTTHIITDEIRMDPALLQRYYLENRISIGFISPRLFSLFKKELPDFMRIVMAGEKICNIDPKNQNIIVLYGLTEAADILSYCVEAPTKEAFLGKPVSGTQVFLLNEQGEDVGFMREGEICAKGIYPRRYLNLPDETGKVFEETEDGEVIIHTGDIGIRHENGVIQYVNRRDLMVKINGMRVDPGEAEAAILQIEGISHAAVKSFEDETSKVFLCAYYITEPEKDIDADQIRSCLKTKLPYYMIPAFFVKMESFPLNENGKLDRQAFEKPDISSFMEEYIAPRDSVQERICNVFAEVLSMRRVGITDDFFALGGDSIKVMNAAAKLDDIHVSTRMIYMYRTPEKITEAINHFEFVGNISEEEANQSKSENPLIIPYQRFYIDYQLYAPKTTGGHIPFYLEIPEPRYTASEIAVALEKVFRHFSVFGTVFEFGDDGNVRLSYKPEFIAPVEIIEASETDVYNRCKEDVKKQLPVFGRLPYKAELFVCKDKIILYMVFQHFLMDGTSLMNTLQALMDVLKNKPLWVDTYYYYLKMLEDTHKLEHYKNKLKELYSCYFNNEFDRLPKFEHFTDDKGIYRRYEKMPFSYSELIRKTEEKGISIGNLFNAAGLLALRAYNGSDKVQISWIYTGRYEKWMEKIIGITMTALPLAIDFSVIDSIDKLYEEINRQNSELIPYAALSPALENNSPVLVDSMRMIYEGGVNYPDDLFENASGKDLFGYRTSSPDTISCLFLPLPAEDSAAICVNVNAGVYTEKTAVSFVKLIEKYMLQLLDGKAF